MISVCIATYNGQRYIKKQLTSILNQLDYNDEVIISDDNSTDGTIEIIKSLNDKRIKIFQHQKVKTYNFKLVRNTNFASKNFENALNKCSGDFIFLADQDDIWENDKIEKILPYFTKYDLVYHNFSEIDENSISIKKYHFENEVPLKKYFFKNYIRMPFAGCCMAFKSDILNYVLPFPDRIIAHDQWIGLLVCKKGKPIYLKEPLIKRRFHSNNFSLYNGEESFFDKLKYKYLTYKSNFQVLFK